MDQQIIDEVQHARPERLHLDFSFETFGLLWPSQEALLYSAEGRSLRPERFSLRFAESPAGLNETTKKGFQFPPFSCKSKFSPLSLVLLLCKLASLALAKLAS